MNLSGWYLTDDANNLTKWQFPSKVIPGGGYLVVSASNKDRAGANDPKLHTNIKLTSTGEYLALVKPDGQTTASFYAPYYPPIGQPAPTPGGQHHRNAAGAKHKAHLQCTEVEFKCNGRKHHEEQRMTGTECHHAQKQGDFGGKAGALKRLRRARAGSA